jgi:hypothetical protein
MPVTLVNHAVQRVTPTATACSVSFNVGTLTDGVLIVGIRPVDGTAPTAVQFNGSSMTSIGSVGNLHYFRLVAPTQGGAYNVTWTISTNVNCHYAFSSWSGVDQATPIGTPVTATGNSATPSTGSVTCPSNGAVLGILRHFYSGTAISTTAGTSIGTYQDGNGVHIAHAYRTSTGAVSWGNLENYAYDAAGLPLNSASAGGNNDLASSATAGATASAAITVQRNLAAAAVAGALASGTLSVNRALTGAAIGAALGSATLTAFSSVWRIPTKAPNGTAVHATVFSGASPTYAMLAQGTAIVAGGFVDIPGIGSIGAKAFAFVHNYADNTAIRSIRGGAAIATLTSL